MSVGTRLRQAREQQGITLDAVSGRTRIPLRVLHAIEHDDYATVPDGIYRRGYLRAIAAELRLSADEVLRTYADDHPAPLPPPNQEPPRGSLPRSTQWAGALVVLLIALGTVFAIRPASGTAARESEPAPAGAPGAPDPAAAGTGVVGTSGQSTTIVPHAAPRKGFTVRLEARAPAWVAASADGQRVIYRLMPEGERVTFTAEQEIAMRVGDAGAVFYGLDGGPLAPVGERGAVRNLVITREDGKLKAR